MTPLDLVNRALLRVSEPTIGDWTVAGHTASVARTLFTPTFREVLAEDDWHWARRRAVLVEDTGYTNLLAYDYAYDLPSDCEKVLFISPDVTYQIEDNHLFCNTASDTADADAKNHEPLITYTRLMLTADANGDPEWEAGLTSAQADRIIRPMWAQAVVSKLALKFSIAINNDKMLYRELMGEYQFHLKEARGDNALETPGEPDAEDTWEYNNVTP